MTDTDWDDIPVLEAPPKAETRVWSEEQLKIKEWAKTAKGNARVTARAGTGKTTTIESMIVPNAVEKKILYVVFNKKNQLEAQKKIVDGRCDIKTFNALGYGFVKQNWQNARPDDDVERDRVKAAEPGMPDRVVSEVVKLIAWAKNTEPHAERFELEELADRQGIEVEAYDASNWPSSELARVAEEAMSYALDPDDRGRISFNDQVWLPVVKGWVKPWWDLILVDEAQDMNQVQLEMIEKCYKAGGRLAFVGDERQAIYGFRGADSEAMQYLSKKFNAQELKLTTTYRCAKKIVEAARELVPDYRAAPDAPDGIVRTVVGSDGALKELKVGDAVLSRVNAPLMPLCLALLKKGVPARIEGRDIGKMLAAIARKFNAQSVPDFIKKVSSWRDKKVSRVRAKALSFEAKVGQIAGIDDQADVFFALAEDAKGVTEIMEKLTTLFSDSEEGERPKVTLSSVHRAKGLEWERVFILKSTLRAEKGGEEANIAYVATTRAKRELVWIV